MKFANIKLCQTTGILSALVFFSLSVVQVYAAELDETQLRTLGTSISKGEDVIRSDELADWIIQGTQDYLLVDIRSAEDYETSHIQGAINIPVITLFSNGQINQLPKEKIVVLYSNANIRSAQAATALRLAGLNAYVLLGGYEHWVMHTLNPEAASAEDPNLEQLDDARRAAIARALKNCETPCPGSSQGYVPPLTPVTETPLPPPPSSGGGVLLDEGC